MNRQIIFRAKTLNNGDWVQGDLEYSRYNDTTRIHVYDENGFYDGQHYVQCGTVGQYTGVDDKNGKRIFEGDILKFDDVYCEVGWNPMQSAFCIRFPFETRLGLRTLGAWLVEKRNTVVVGNIHDSPELLDEKTSQ